MKPITAEWVGKAEGDFATVERGIAGACSNPNCDGVCFRAQQCAEKICRRCRIFRRAALTALGLPT